MHQTEQQRMTMRMLSVQHLQVNISAVQKHLDSHRLPTTCVNQSWKFAQQSLNRKCNSRVSCFFSNNHREEQARRALESALGGKKSEFEKQDNEIRKREWIGGGGGSGRGGWFGWGGHFGGSNGDHYWEEAQQIILTLLGLIFLYLVIAKGEVMLVVISNPLLLVSRGTKNRFKSIISRIMRKTNPKRRADINDTANKKAYTALSAKDRVIKKWGSD